MAARFCYPCATELLCEVVAETPAARPATKLSELEVQTIANAAATSPMFRGRMTITRVEATAGGRVLWHVSSDTRGSGLWVTVDDATAEVVEQRIWYGESVAEVWRKWRLW